MPNRNSKKKTPQEQKCAATTTGLLKETYNAQLAFSGHNTVVEALVAKAPGRVLLLCRTRQLGTVSFLQEPKPC
jgi:hypothetical protein